MFLTPAERDRAIESMEDALKALKTMPVVTPCAKCDNFQEGRCLHWNADVPEAAQAAGCHEWQEAIPF